MSIDFGQYALLVVCAGLASVIGVVSGVSAIWKNIVITRAARDPARTPPLAEEIAKTYATKAELAALRDNLNRSLDHIDGVQSETFSLVRQTQKDIIDKIDALSQHVGEWQRGVERQIGKMEGKK
jgi:aromatic ring hydroxylase